MARVSIYYDKDLKEQFFMVRGDERYARSTKTILAKGAVTTSTYDFCIKLNVNVLRDVGQSAIMIYDNDAPVGMIPDWESTDNSREIPISELTYGADHVFTAKYMGNKECSPSWSNAITVNVPDTNRAVSNLTFLNTNSQFIPHDSLSNTITLTNDKDNPLYNIDQPIEVFYDGNSIGDPILTNDEGQITFSISDVGDIGLHTIRAEYGGGEHLTTKTINMSISVGYILEPVSTPSLIIKGVETSFRISLKDCLGNPIQNTNIQMIDTYHSSLTPIDVVSTNAQGIATFTETINDANSDGGMQHYQFLSTISNVEYDTNVDVPYVIPSSLTITSSTPQLYQGEETVLSIQTNSTLSNTPIQITGDLEETLYTDSNGLATKTITGVGTGAKSLVAHFGSLTKNITLNDYIQYWQPKNIHNQDYVSFVPSVANLNNLFRFQYDSQSAGGALQLPIEPNVDYELLINGVTTSKSATIAYLKNNTSWKNSSVVIWDFVTNLVPHSNETWRIIRENGTVSVYRNNNLQNTYQNQGEYLPSIAFVLSSNGGNADFTKLTLRRL